VESFRLVHEDEFIQISVQKGSLHIELNDGVVHGAGESKEEPDTFVSAN